ncbi:MAG: hypothetical protein SPLUMA2_SPLUMAMAG2_00286 [uncultured Sulfurimonas sp.]|nr:MAG: hypothetical protein SPLUMA2_SPLUMAMAG2_00286 [uncultured Sulfurimonas sp.]
MKYKKPALKSITAFSSVAVEVKDSDGVCTAQGIFGWFISKI